jgi:hypothetical protein
MITVNYITQLEWLTEPDLPSQYQIRNISFAKEVGKCRVFKIICYRIRILKNHVWIIRVPAEQSFE